MKNFTSIKDVADAQALLKLCHEIKKNPFGYSSLGKNKTLGLLFFNPSLRTRLSTQKAALNLGMNVMIMNISSDGWAIELEDGTKMNEGSQEHIKDAAAVISQYCDIIGLRTFASLTSKKDDYDEVLLNKFIRHATVPILSLESATLHPLQSLADLMTIQEQSLASKPKIVLSWAPHPRALPQAVANSFLQWVKTTDAEVVITHPKGYELSDEFTDGMDISYNQEDAFKNADFIYAKNWSSFTDYGTKIAVKEDWCIDTAKMKKTNQAKFMHCLPIRRNVVATDSVLDAESSLIMEQTNNRTYAAQAVLLQLLKNEN